MVLNYIINDDSVTSNNAKDIYNKLYQDNIQKKREIQIMDYKTKAYIEYSSLLKLSVFLVIIIIPFIVLTKYEILNKKISFSAIICILFLGFSYILYKLYLLYRKDSINFNKYKVPYDRQTQTLIKNNKLEEKSLIGGLGITCVGEECCSDGMSYDFTKNKCFPLTPATTG